MDKKIFTLTGLPTNSSTNVQVVASSPFPSVPPDTKIVKIDVLEPPKPQAPPRRTPIRRDPLAQTFQLPEADAYLTKVQLKFVAAPPAPASVTAADPDVRIEVREVENGIPTDMLVVEPVRVSAADVRDRLTTASGVVDFVLPTPTLLRAGQRYAVVVATDSPLYQVYYAELGQLEIGATSSDGRIKTQPYPEGTLLQSSDLASWEPLPNRDLWFRLHFAQFDNTSETFTFDEMLVGRPNVVGFRLHALFNLMQSERANLVTEVAWEYRTAPLETSTVWSNWRSVQPFSNQFLDAPFQKIQLRVRLRGGGTSLVSPFVDLSSLRVEFFEREASSRVVSKQLTLAAAYQSVRMVAKLWVPSSAAQVRWYFSDGRLATTPAAYSAASSYSANALVTYQATTYVALGSVAAGSTPGPSNADWAEVELFNSMVWRLVPATGETKVPVPGLEAGWYEHERQVTLSADATRTKFFYMFKLSSQNVAQAPALKDVVCILNA
jgi:hypothetical protein